MDPLNTIFWAGQKVYIMKVFLPVIIGFSVFFIGLVVLFFLILWRLHYRLWHLGKDENRSDQIVARLKTLFAVIFAHSRFWRDLYPGTMHFLIFWGVILLFLGKIVRLFSYPVGLTIPPQEVFLYASFASEIGGVLIVAGGCMAIVRRYIVRPSRLDTSPDNGLIFIWGFMILLTGYLIKSYRITAIGVDIPPGWFSWAPVSYPISRLILILSSERLNELLVWHRVLIHAIPALIFFVYIIVSHSHMQHIFISPLNIFFRPLKPNGAFTPIHDLEEAENFGVTSIKDFTWSQLLALEACTRCGRCQDNCPSYLAKEPLSPKSVVQNLKGPLLIQGKILLSSKAKEEALNGPLVGKVINGDEIWACTTCGACENRCPVYISSLDLIRNIRIGMIEEGRSVSPLIRDALEAAAKYGNPWGNPPNKRSEWANELKVKDFSRGDEAGLLYFVGCLSSYDQRVQEIAKAMVETLNRAGVDFAILGAEEVCSGDPGRRLGENGLFEMMVESNYEIFSNYNIKSIVTTCPHCYNTFKNEYPLLRDKLEIEDSADFKVEHFTQLIARLIDEGRLKFSKEVNKVVTYHDPCYLGRHNGVYDAPRRILKAIPGLKLVEMKRSKENSFCCGGGGGRMWMEDLDVEEKIPEIRVKEALETKAEILATACPFCLSMLDDALKTVGGEEEMQVRDILEIVIQAI